MMPASSGVAETATTCEDKCSRRPARAPVQALSLWPHTIQEKYMNSFVETISPAAKNHALARIDYFSDLTLATLQSVRKLSEVNLQFSRDWLQESTESVRAA